METITREGFDELKRILRQKENEGECPVWPGSPAGTVQTGDVNAPKSFWSPRAGGMFTIPAGFPNQPHPDAEEETRKLISSWIWERNAALDHPAGEDKGELPALTPAAVRELRRPPPLTVEQRIDRALRAIGKPPNSLDDSLGSPASEPERLFQSATERGGDAAEMDWLLRELSAAGLVRHTRESIILPLYMLTLGGLHRLETGGEALVWDERLRRHAVRRRGQRRLRQGHRTCDQGGRI